MLVNLLSLAVTVEAWEKCDPVAALATSSLLVLSTVYNQAPHTYLTDSHFNLTQLAKVVALPC